MSQPVAITNGDLTARIDPLGAELVSLTDSAGAEWLTDADPAFWAGHAPLLFPIVGRLNGDVLRVDGREYAMRQHGFARRMVWDVVDTVPDAATFQLGDNDETRTQYPFAFELWVRYALDGATLVTTVRVRNPGDTPLPFSFGFHPAFAWPLPGGGEKLAHSIEFEFPEPDAVRRLDGAGLLSGREPTAVRASKLSLHPDLFATDAMIWDFAMSRKLTYRGEHGVAVNIDFPGMPYLAIWQKPGANFICIEPWQGHADPVGFAGEFADKPGIITIPPGDERSLRMDVTLHPG